MKKDVVKGQYMKDSNTKIEVMKGQDMKSVCNSELIESGLFGSIDYCIISNQILELFIDCTFSALFWLQSELRQKFVPLLVWIQRYFKVDMSIL